MKILLNRLIFALAIMLFFQESLKSQSSVYICPQTGLYSFCYGRNNTDECAYNRIMRQGARHPVSIFYTPQRGFGAIAVGRDRLGYRITGASGGYFNPQQAKARALRECRRAGGRFCRIDALWLDR